MLQDIRKATQSITIETYIFNIDPLTLNILDALGDARARGVSVKIIVDGFGAYYNIPELDRLCSRRGLELRVFHPLPYPLLFVREFFSKYSLSGSLFYKSLNRRTHRKVTIIDEKRAYLGSLNFTQDHSAQYKGDRAWRDTGVWVEGPPIKALVLAFQISYLRTYVKGLTQWIGRWKLNREPFEKVLRLNSTQKSRRRLYKDLLARLSRAEKRIYVTTAYFLPKRSLLRAFLKAAQRGVDVQILMPGKSDVPMVKWAAFSMVRFLLQKKITIFEYQKSILHAKTMIIDDDVFIGSFNLNHRSILHDLEVEVVLRDPESLKSMLNQWALDIQNSKLVGEKDFGRPSWLIRPLYRLAFRLRYLL
jgi:cardiolipin synthase